MFVVTNEIRAALRAEISRDARRTRGVSRRRLGLFTVTDEMRAALREDVRQIKENDERNPRPGPGT